ncbi:MAG: 3-oxoacyl-ACP synthase III family protein [Gemmatimonadota bacterium]
MIRGTGLHAPGDPIPNEVFNERYGMDVDAFLRENRNIRQRHFMAADQATSDLVVPAARQALAEAGIGPEDLDLVIVATDTPDYISPSTASVVQHKLGAVKAGTFDVNTACAGFVTVLDMAWKYIVADPAYEHILIAGAYGMSKYLDMDDYKLATLFADGAGAAVVSACEVHECGTEGVMASELYAEGSFHDYMGIYAGGTYMPATPAALEGKHHRLQFVKKFPAETNPKHWPRLIRSVLNRIGKAPSDVDRYFFTQVNIASINETLRLLGVPEDRSHNVMDRFAYTGSACIPMAMADAADQGLLHEGDLVVLMGSGGGMAMAALALEWGYDT